MKRIVTCFFLFCMTFSLCGVTHASLVYIDAGPFATISTWATGDYTTGTEFTVTNPLGIQVDQLGYIDGAGDGLATSHQVGLWRVSDQSLLASVIVTPGSDTQLSANGDSVWYLEDIGSTLTLTPGAYRVAGFTGSADSETMVNDRIGNGVTLTSGYVRTTFPGGGFNYPNLNFPTNGVRATVAFSAVPEPTTATFMAGLGFLICIRRRKRR